MDEFSYLSVLLSIIIGLSVAQILIGIRGCLLTRARIRQFWPVHVWAAFFLLVSAQAWWAMFGLRYRHSWDFADYAILLVQVIVLYLLTGLIYPEFSADDRQVDLRAHYFAQRRHFFSFCIVLLAISICRDLVLDHKLPAPSNLAFHLVFIAFAVSGILSGREWYHKLAVIIVSATFVLYIITLFTRLE
jgi:ABC-type enterobactin transport system permease subunit